LEGSAGIPGGSFRNIVSVDKSSRLTGCIGTIHAPGWLLRGTPECSRPTSVNDPLFARRTIEEPPMANVEITLFSRVERIEDFRKIEGAEHPGLTASS
jgi:AMMECR1 domain-containing protein